MAFVGCVVADERRFRTTAFNRAGNMFQTNLLAGLREAGAPVSTVVSPVPIQSMPSGRSLFVRSHHYRLDEITTVDSLAFVNILAFKQVTIGLGVLKRLLAWGWRHRKSKNRVVCTFNLSVPPGAFTLLAARMIGAKTVALLYDLSVPGVVTPNSLLTRLDYRLQQWLIPHFDALVVASDAIVCDSELRAPHIRVEGGFDPKAFANTASRTDPALFVIVSVGTLNETNGIGVLLEAFSMLKGDQYRLRIAGNGELVDKVKEASANDGRIEYLGYLAFADVLALYESADVLVCMRLTESVDTKYFFPSKLMEYLASGRPVITTCTGQVAKEFGSFTYLLREETAEALASLIKNVSLKDQGLREQKGIAARDYMMANKTWAEQGRRIVKLIKSLFKLGADEMPRL